MTTTFDGKIYYQRAAFDTDEEFSYPHIILEVEKYSDAQKGIVGQLTADIITTQYTQPRVEKLERQVRRTLEGVFFNAQEIFSLKWRQTELFSEPASEKLPLIYGATLTFDIYEYPSVKTHTPDIIEALNYWASCFEKNWLIIGAGEFEEFYEPTRDNPAIYFDIERIRMTSLTNESAFVDATVNVHLFAPTVTARREWLARVHEELLLVKGIWLADNSPARLQDSEWDWTRSEIEGQLQLKYNYGIIRKAKYYHTLEEAKWRLENGQCRCDFNGQSTRISAGTDLHDRGIEGGK